MLAPAWDLTNDFARGFRPRPDITPSEWADENGVLSAESSAEPGEWRTYSYQIAMMDAFVHPMVETVVVKKSARIGWTKILGHIIGYHVHLEPCPLLVVQPTIEDAQGWSKEELQPMIDDTPVLRGLVSDQKSRSSSNTITKKHYDGGIAHVVGANSPRGFRRITVKMVLFDEVDGYPPTAGTEGDQIKLGVKRTETFWDRKIGIGSTPTEKGFSRVEKHFDRSSRGYYILTCPHCGDEHVRLFRQPEKPLIVRDRELHVSHLHWPDGDPDSAAWVCSDCGGHIDHSHHRRMMNAGYWFGDDWEWRRETGFVFEDGFRGSIGFFIWAGYSYSPNSTPPKLANEFLSVKNDAEELKTFVNTVLGEAYEEKGEKPSSHVLMGRREQYADEVPSGVQTLTLGVDVQKDRIEAELVGWNRRRESWNINYYILPGDTAQKDVWDDLFDLIKQKFQHQSGAKLPIRGILIDSGFNTKQVYEFCKRAGINVFPGKGVTGKRPIVEDEEQRRKRLRKQRRKGVKPEIIGVDEGKWLVYQQLGVVKPGPNYCHFPMERDEEYFLQMTAEKLMRRYHKGRPVLEWVPERARNEVLDCRVGALAAVHLTGGFDNMTDPVPVEDKPAEGKKRRRRQSSGDNIGYDDEWAL
jgi:phage terminase large subunit GpA-like protein